MKASVAISGNDVILRGLYLGKLGVAIQELASAYSMLTIAEKYKSATYLDLLKNSISSVDIQYAKAMNQFNAAQEYFFSKNLVIDSVIEPYLSDFSDLKETFDVKFLELKKFAENNGITREEDLNTDDNPPPAGSIDQYTDIDDYSDDSDEEQWIPGIKNDYILYGGAFLLLLVVLRR
jgi:hypothetical protein